MNGRLLGFAKKYPSELPEECVAALEAHVALGTVPPSGGSECLNIGAVVAPFAVLVAEMDYLLADSAQHIFHLSERAFAHLQRSIVASRSTRKDWVDAFEDGETSCENLGAAHLLLHGIYAFKAHGPGERTDLVFGDSVDIPKVSSIAEGLVLTEWKKVDGEQKAGDAFKAAINQAEIYGKSLLGGIELRKYRYIVLVSRERLRNLPPDSMIGDVTYRCVNISVDPATPSVAARESRRPRETDLRRREHPNE